jgi:uncharacterized protein YjbI with pentapeptide repeats
MTMAASAVPDALPEKKGRPSVAWRPRRSPQPTAGLPHAEVLRAGVPAWNKWRREHPGVVPNLHDLKVSISERQFGPVQGGPVNLSRAEICRGQLDQATLVEANLMGAVLTDCDLSDARLDNADLRGAKLARANLLGARLTGANLCGADLRLAKGLEQAQVDQALGDSRTSLPAHLARPERWLQDGGVRPDEHASPSDAAVRSATADPYAILGVDRGASFEDIRIAWLKLVKDLDLAGASKETLVNARLQDINQAYQTLKEHSATESHGRRGSSRLTKPVAAAALAAALGALVLGLETYLSRSDGSGDATATARIARHVP